MEEALELIERLAKRLSRERNLDIRSEDVFAALFMLWESEKDLEWIPDVVDLELDADATYTLLSDFDFAGFKIDIVTEYELIEDIRLYEIKVLIKSSGVVWKIHLNDPDPFPSNPHAHQLDNNIKLDLSTGDCYRKRKYLKTIRKKELLKIRAQAATRYKDELPPLMV